MEMTLSQSCSFRILSIIISYLTIAACGNSEKWVCKSGINANGKAVQYSENTDTGEIGAYSKCQK